MARRAWKFTLDGNDHEIILDHNFWSSRRRAWIDGVLAFDVRPVDTFAHEYELAVNSRRCIIRIGRTALTLAVDYELRVDGELIEATDLSPITPEQGGGRGGLLAPADSPINPNDELLRPARGSKDRDHDALLRPEPIKTDSEGR